MQHRAQPAVRGRHRAPRTPDPVGGGRARSTTLAAALIGGFAVAVVSAATSPASGHVESRTDSPAVAATPVPAEGYATDFTPDPGDTAESANAAEAADAVTAAERFQISVTPAARKARPKPKPAPITAAAAAAAAAWVNPLPEAAVTSCFGQRWGRLHAGVDLAAPDGTRIRAAGAGLVVAAGPAEGYGNAVLIDHGNGYLTHYGHMSVVVVRTGQRVVTGERIGDEGSTGHSTGPHLHFEVHEGHYKNPVEPTAWMHEHGVDITGCVPVG